MTKRIDDSHQPYKRTKKIGPGPRKAPPKFLQNAWICKKGTPTKAEKGKFYIQLCKFVGAGASPSTKPRRIKTKVKTKKKYNKLYRKWAAANRKKLQARGKRPGYECRKTPSTKCA